MGFMGQLVVSGDSVAAGVMGVIQDRMVNMLDAFARQYGIAGQPRTADSHGPPAAPGPSHGPGRSHGAPTPPAGNPTPPVPPSRKRPVPDGNVPPASASTSGKPPAKAAKSGPESERLQTTMPATVSSKVWLVGDSQLKRIPPRFLRSGARVTALGGHSVHMLRTKLQGLAIQKTVETIIVMVGSVDIFNKEGPMVPKRLADLACFFRDQLKFQGRLMVVNLPALPLYGKEVQTCNAAIDDTLSQPAYKCSVVDFADLMLSDSSDPLSARKDHLESDGKHVTDKAMQRLLIHIAGQGVPVTFIGYRKPKPAQQDQKGDNKSPLLRPDPAKNSKDSNAMDEEIDNNEKDNAAE